MAGKYITERFYFNREAWNSEPGNRIGMTLRLLTNHEGYDETTEESDDPRESHIIFLKSTAEMSAVIRIIINHMSGDVAVRVTYENIEGVA